MSHEKMLTEVEVKLISLETTPSLLMRSDDEFRVEVFLACSRTTSKMFRLQCIIPIVAENKIEFAKQGINSPLHIKSVVGTAL